jgi:hypothetical protein
MGLQVLPLRAGEFIGAASTQWHSPGTRCDPSAFLLAAPDVPIGERVLAAPAGGIFAALIGSHTAWPAATGESGGARRYFLQEPTAGRPLQPGDQDAVTPRPAGSPGGADRGACAASWVLTTRLRPGPAARAAAPGTEQSRGTPPGPARPAGLALPRC